MTDKKLEITQNSINILLDPKSISQKNIWEINIIEILEALICVLNKSRDKDLKMAGMAALSSSLIHKMKVETIFSMHKPAPKKVVHKKNNVNIKILDIPYRHETTYPVTLNELLEVLGNLIGSITNPITHKKKIDLIEPLPDFNKYLIPYENLITEYEELVMNSFHNKKIIYFNNISSTLKSREAVRCFIAILFLAKDKKVELKQLDNDDIEISLINNAENKH